MNLTFLALIALFPIFLTLFLRIHGWLLSKAMLVCCLVTAALAWLVWKVKFLQIAASMVQGCFLSLEIIAFLFIAVGFLHMLERSHAMAAMRATFWRLSLDRRVQAIMIGWFLGAGVEGLLGFGVTGGVCSIMLAGLGFPPACALMMGVMGPVVGGTFCSAGAPVLFGVAHGMQNPLLLTQTSMATMDFGGYLHVVTIQTAMLSGIAGTFVPLLMVMMMTRFFGPKKSWTEGLSIAPFAIFSGLAFTIPFVLAAIFMGPELASLVGAVMGAAVGIIVVRMKFLIPRDRWDFPPPEQWESDWAGGQRREKYVDVKSEHDYSTVAPQFMTPWRAWLPFALLAFLVVFSRWSELPLRDWLLSFSFEKFNLFGSSVNIISFPFYLPLTIILLVVVGVTFVLHRLRPEDMRYAFGGWGIPIAWLAVRIMPFTLAIACIYLNSSPNASGYVSMPLAIAKWMAHLPGAEFWMFFLSPFFGASLAFFGANNTFSNAMLSSFQHHLGQNLMAPQGLFVALQAVGAAFGNMVSWRYLAGAGSIVGMLGWSAPIGRKTVLPMFVLLIIVGLVATVTVHVFNISALLFPW